MLSHAPFDLERGASTQGHPQRGIGNDRLWEGEDGVSGARGVDGVAALSIGWGELVQGLQCMYMCWRWDGGTVLVWRERVIVEKT